MSLIAPTFAIKACVRIIACALAVASAGNIAAAASGGMPPEAAASIADRIQNRIYPSVFQAWNPVVNLDDALLGPAVPLAKSENALASMARHDLVFVNWPKLGLKPLPSEHFMGLTNSFTPESVAAALRNRATLLRKNQNLILLVAVNYYSAPLDYFGANSPWWRRGPDGHLVGVDPKAKSYKLDFSDPGLQDAVAAHCAALVKTGVFDGCMLDWWHEDGETAGRLALIRKVRAAIGEEAILIGNVNGRLPVQTAPYLNGMYMEGFGNRVFADWREAANNLRWGEAHLRQPAITALEGWWTPDRDHYATLREVTALSLVFSNGYVLFAGPDSLPTPDHLHDWYPLWDKTLGRPTGPPATPGQPNFSQGYRRAYQNGEVIFNPPANARLTVQFPRSMKSAATGVVGTTFTIEPGGGDLFLNVATSASDGQR